MKAIKTILGLIRQADQKYNLFAEKDRIMIGVSGGKDSMVLAHALSIYQRFNFANFKIVPAILDLGFDGFDASEMKKFFRSIGLELKVIDAKDVYPILKAQQKGEKHLPCSICSRMKKAAINKAAKKYKCNKVAFAHHADDAIETLFMNEIYGARIATFEPKMHLERANIDFIRPLILVRESDIIAYQKEEEIPVFSSHCPNDGFTKRAEIKELLNNIYRQYPSAKDNFLTMLSNYSKEKIFSDNIAYKIEKTPISFRPVINVNDANIDNMLRKKLRFSIKENIDGLNKYIIYLKNTPIGVFSFLRKDKNTIVIYDLELMKKYVDKYYEFLLDEIKKDFSRRICPVTISLIQKY